MFGLALRQVFEGDVPAIGAHVGVDRPRDLAGIEIFHTGFRETAVGPAHVGVLQDVAHIVEAAVRLPVDFGGRRKFIRCSDTLDPAVLRRLQPEAVNPGPDREAFLAIGDGGLDEIRERPRPETLEPLGERLDRHRRGRRGIADFVDLPLQDEAETVVALADDEMLPHVGSRRQRRAAVELDIGVLAGIGAIDLHRPKARDPAHLRIDNGLHERRGDRRIHDVAAVAQNVEPRVHRLRLRGAHHTVGHVSSFPIPTITLYPAHAS